MRVLLIDVNCKHSSTGKIVYDLFTSLSCMGHKAAICYGRGPIVNEPFIYKFGIDVETFFHAILARITGFNGYFSPISTFRLIRFLKKFNPDVVHIHDLHAYFVNIAPLINYLKKKNIKTIWTFHCEFMYTGKCGLSYDCEKWKTECNKCPQTKDYPASLFFDFTKTMFLFKKRLFEGFTNLVIVTPSNWLAERVKQSFLRNKDIRVIYNGIDTKLFYPRETTNLRKKHDISSGKVVLAVAPNVMSDAKGGKWIIKLADKCKDDDIKFVLIGVKNLQEKFGQNVIALPRIANQNELAEYYSLADITLLLSKKESFSLVCVESIACGTPVLGFHSGGPGEIVTDGFGVFVDYGDIDSLINVLNSTLFRRLNKSTKEECLRYATSKFSLLKMIKKYRTVYES